MEPDRVERISNIKATAWVTVIFFSLGGYLIFSTYVMDSLIASDMARGFKYELPDMEDDTSNEYFRRVAIVSFLVCLYTALIVYGGVGLLRLKVNGLIVFHVTTIVLILVIVGTVIYMSLNIKTGPAPDEFTRTAYYYVIFKSISIEGLLLIMAWVLVKVNLMLMRREYRGEFS